MCQILHKSWTGKSLLLVFTGQKNIVMKQFFKVHIYAQYGLTLSFQGTELCP